MLDAYWKDFFAREKNKSYFQKLQSYILEAYQTKIIYPKKENIWRAFQCTPYQDIKVVILGQDPYHQPNQAHGLAFSVNKGVKIPPSLLNIYKELYNDLQIPIASHGDLSEWAKQGVFLLNTILTVEHGKAKSHHNIGWEQLTDAVIQAINQKETPVIFLLWGKDAQTKAAFITNPIHKVIKAPHPSPLSAHTGFFHQHYFSKVNTFLLESNQTPIDWRVSE